MLHGWINFSYLNKTPRKNPYEVHLRILVVVFPFSRVCGGEEKKIGYSHMAMLCEGDPNPLLIPSSSTPTFSIVHELKSLQWSRLWSQCYPR